MQPNKRPTSKSRTLHRPSSLIANAEIRRKVSPDRELLKAFLVVDDEPLLVCQMQQANETIRRRYVRHGLLGIYALEAVHDRREIQRIARIEVLLNGGFCGSWDLS
jgi:hypothetical protein